MFNSKKTPPSALEVAIADHIAEFAGTDAGSEQQQRSGETLKTLLEARRIEQELEKPWFQPSADQMITAAASLAGILSILTFEKWNVLTSKSLSFVVKPK